MIWLWILGILILLAVLIARTRIGVRVRFGEGLLWAALTVGPFRVPLTGEEKAAQQKDAKPAKKRKQTAKKAPKKDARPRFPKVTAADVKEAVRTLWPPLKKALGRTRRSIRLDPMTVSVVIGAAEDPAAGAEAYGWASGAMYNLLPALEELVRIPDPRAHIGLDFDSGETRAEGEIGLSVRIGTLIAVGFGVGVPALRWLTELRRKQEAAPPAAAETPPAHTDAA